MRSLAAVLSTLALAGCASSPTGPVAFRAASLHEEDSASPGDGQAADFAGVAVTEPARATTSSAPAEDVLDVRYVTLYLGERDLDENTAEALDVDDQTVAGADFNSYDRSSGNGFEVGFSHSSEDNDVGPFNAEVRMDDVYGGYRKTFRPEANDFHPYVSLGLALLKGDVDVGPTDDDDTTLGPYIRAGIGWDVGDRTRIGLDYRRLFANLDIFGDNFDADYDQFALSVGFPF